MQSKPAPHQGLLLPLGSQAASQTPSRALENAFSCRNHLPSPALHVHCNLRDTKLTFSRMHLLLDVARSLIPPRGNSQSEGQLFVPAGDALLCREISYLEIFNNIMSFSSSSCVSDLQINTQKTTSDFIIFFARRKAKEEVSDWWRPGPELEEEQRTEKQQSFPPMVGSRFHISRRTETLNARV